MSGEVEGEGRRADGGPRADDEGQCRTADGDKFLLFFSNTLFYFYMNKSFDLNEVQTSKNLQ